jgi:putative toxin-antitoxin system antitoxin component (TIGR02293 family)
LAQTDAPGDKDLFAKWLDQSMEAAATGHVQPLSVKELEAAWSPRFNADEIDALVIPRRTLARRKASSAELSPEEADRAFRLAQIQGEADRVFGNLEKSSRWLRTPNNRLSGQTPLSVLRTAAGAALVAEMLGQIDHGIFA